MERLSFVATAWRGGRLKDLWKKKGSPHDCDMSRGLLLSDHSAKVLTGLLKEGVDDTYCKYVPTEQCGCITGRSASFA
eukprot:2634549-Karenia_brevis.AAC.1